MNPTALTRCLAGALAEAAGAVLAPSAAAPALTCRPPPHGGPGRLPFLRGPGHPRGSKHPPRGHVAGPVQGPSSDPRPHCRRRRHARLADHLLAAAALLAAVVAVPIYRVRAARQRAAATPVHVAMARGTEMLERRRGWNMHWTPVGLGDDDLAGRRASEKVAACGVVDERPSPHGPRAGVERD